MEREHLHLLIHEEVYRLPEDESKEVVYVERTEPLSVAEPEPAPLADVQPEKVEAVEEIPSKPVDNGDTPQEWPFAVFHSSKNESEIELLHKIIAAQSLAKPSVV